MVRALMSRDRLRQTSKVVTQLTKPQATNITCVHMIYLCVLVMDDSNECKSIEFANIKDPLLAFAEDFSKSGQGRVTSKLQISKRGGVTATDKYYRRQISERERGVS